MFNKIRTIPFYSVIGTSFALQRKQGMKKEDAMTEIRFDFGARFDTGENTDLPFSGAVMKRLRARIARRPGRWRRRMQTKTHRGRDQDNDFPAAA